MTPSTALVSSRFITRCRLSASEARRACTTSTAWWSFANIITGSATTRRCPRDRPGNGAHRMSAVYVLLSVSLVIVALLAWSLESFTCKGHMRAFGLDLSFRREWYRGWCVSLYIGNRRALHLWPHFQWESAA